MWITSKPILLVDDDLVDAMTVQRALKEVNVSNPLDHAENGEEALSYLRTRDGAGPCIILLDLNMPLMTGIEFLRIVKADRKLRRIPVIVLTTSGEQQDKVESFDLGAAGYIRKPLDYNRFVEIVRTVNDYWTVSEFPE